MESSTLKWVYESVIIVEGHMKPGQKDWMSLFKAYSAYLGLTHFKTGSDTAIHWKCSRHMYPYIGGECPVMCEETIVHNNADIDKALAHCMSYSVWDLELYVGADPRKRVELKA